MAGGHPLRIGITDLVRHPGSRLDVARAVELDGLAISTAAVPVGESVEVDLELEAILGGLTATGTVRVPWQGECRRCLEPVTGVAEAHVQEVFEREPTEGETYPLGTDIVDLEPMVRDAALLALPLAPLCEDGCRGPAPDAFPAAIEGEVAGDGGEGDGGEDAPPDPRWGALDQLKFD